MITAVKMIATYACGLLVPSVLLKRLVVATSPADADAPELTGTPDSWLPPMWLPASALGAQHPNARHAR
jgi:hypothetical protein